MKWHHFSDSNSPLQNDTSGLPLFKEEWLDDLLSRIFELLQNLHSPDTRSDLSVSGQTGGHTEVQSFLLNDDCMFRCRSPKLPCLSPVAVVAARTKIACNYLQDTIAYSSFM